jgi:hypothetical protein
MKEDDLVAAAFAKIKSHPGGLALPHSWSAHRMFVGEGDSGCITVALSKQDLKAGELELSLPINV